MDGNGKTRVLIAGGGVAALEAALALRDLAEDRVSVELLAPEPHWSSERSSRRQAPELHIRGNVKVGRQAARRA